MTDIPSAWKKSGDKRMAVPARFIKTAILLLSLVLLRPAPAPAAGIFRVATYNVENLFDLVLDGTEYPEYVPNGRFGWTRQTAALKYAHIARVIRDLSADVVALQEVESRRALTALQGRLKAMGADYPYLAITRTGNAPVRCALLSRFPVVTEEDVPVARPLARPILRATLDVDGARLVLFVNHWKSKHGPESMRIACARALRKAVDRLKPGADIVLTGDFNSDYNEYITFRKNASLNDTGGITGINHILGTVRGGRLVDEKTLVRQVSNRYFYNLWLEIEEKRRWSYNFFGKKGSPDNMIVSRGLYDGRGISYVDGSFGRFMADYLFRERAVYRWQRARRGKGRHLGKGYSDHLPIFASFAAGPFR